MSTVFLPQLWPHLHVTVQLPQVDMLEQADESYIGPKDGLVHVPAVAAAAETKNAWMTNQNMQLCVMMKL
jgi:hypothetical protein